jgi:hypothetical protein
MIDAPVTLNERISAFAPSGFPLFLTAAGLKVSEITTGATHRTNFHTQLWRQNSSNETFNALFNDRV